MAMNRNLDPPVVVVGAGPVGLMLAGELGLGGIRTVVLESSPEPNASAMGMAINPTVVELLAQRGLEAEGFPLPRSHFAQIWADATLLPEPRAFNHVLPQSALERRLEQHALGLGVEVRRGCRVVGVGQDADGVRLDIEQDGVRSVSRCRYVVGCDGVDSVVRDAAGLEFDGFDTPYYGLVGEVTLPADHALFAYLGAHEFERGLLNVAPSGGSVVRVSTGEFGVAPPLPDAAVGLDELRAHVRHVSGVELDERITEDSVLWLSRWFHRTRNAVAYRSGRVFLAGDAAHTFFPLGGQALGTGLEDAVNLGWKLAAAVRGDAPDGLLDTYHRERHPVAERACLTTQAQVALLTPLTRMAPLRRIIADLIGFREVNNYFVRLAGGLDVRYPPESDEQAHRLVGERLAARVGCAGGETDSAALLGSGRGVLLSFGGGLTAICDTGWTDRVDLVIAEPTADIAAAAILLRPDGRVAWATDRPDDKEGLRESLLRWFGAPTGR
ncbi:FAD-dependent monooxygenase [Nocardia takedensis]